MQANQKLTNTIQGRTVKTVQQKDTDLLIEFEDSSTIHIRTAEPTSSVMVRNSQNKLEYSD